MQPVSVFAKDRKMPVTRQKTIILCKLTVSKQVFLFWIYFRPYVHWSALKN